MNILLVGQKTFGAGVLRLLLARGDTVAVACPRWSDAGEFEHRPECRPDRLYAQAAMFGVPVVATDELRARHVPAGTELIVAAHAHKFIGAPTRAAAHLGAIGYHPSLLPLHRGRDAVRWAVRLRERVTGGTVYWLSDGVDTGDVARQRHVLIPPAATARELWRESLFPLGIRLLADTLEDLDGGVIRRTPQDETVATWEPSLDAAPLHRPELKQIGEGPAGYRVVFGADRDRMALDETLSDAR